MILKTIKGENKREVYIRTFQFLNLIQEDKIKKLNNQEIRVLTEFMMLPEVEYSSFLRFRKKAKDYVLAKYNELYGTKLSRNNLYIIIKNLRDKGLIMKETDGLNKLSPFIEKYILDKKEMQFGVKFEDINNDDNNNN